MSTAETRDLILTDNSVTASSRRVPSEVPVALTYNGVSHVVMMATPKDMEDFAVGFTLTEGIVGSPEEIAEIELRQVEKGWLVWMQIPKPRFEALIDNRRNLVGQTGCGLCGIEDLESAIRTYPKIKTKPHCGRPELFKALGRIRGFQDLNAETGAVHAAGFADWSGRFLSVREDVGRHNALDKLIGDLARRSIDTTQGFALLTSRCSFELVQKALAVAIPMLVTISAPTELAIDMARDHDLTLIALARRDSMLCFNDPFEIFPPE